MPSCLRGDPCLEVAHTFTFKRPPPLALARCGIYCRPITTGWHGPTVLGIAVLLVTLQRERWGQPHGRQPEISRLLSTGIGQGLKQLRTSCSNQTGLTGDSAEGHVS